MDQGKVLTDFISWPDTISFDLSKTKALITDFKQSRELKRTSYIMDKKKFSSLEVKRTGA